MRCDAVLLWRLASSRKKDPIISIDPIPTLCAAFAFRLLAIILFCKHSRSSYLVQYPAFATHLINATIRDYATAPYDGTFTLPFLFPFGCGNLAAAAARSSFDCCSPYCHLPNTRSRWHVTGNLLHVYSFWSQSGHASEWNDCKHGANGLRL